MCIKIVRTKEEFSYDPSKPIEDQIKGSKQILIDYKPNDTSLEKFLDEVERICKSGFSAHMNIKVVHNNFVKGMRVKKRTGQLSNGIDLNDVMKKMALMQSDMDKHLEELSNICFKK